MLPCRLSTSSISVLAAPAFRPARPRYLSASASSKNAVSPSSLPAKKPVGAFRGGLFGFLAGAVASGICVWYYALGDYRNTNEMLTEDIYALQSATQKLQTYVTELEMRADQLQKKK